MVIQTVESSREQFDDGLVWDLLPAWGLHCVWLAGILRVQLLEPNEDEYLWSMDFKAIRHFFQYFQPKKGLAGMLITLNMRITYTDSILTVFYLESIEKALTSKRCTWNFCRPTTVTDSTRIDNDSMVIN
jgi:hypothetical protein